MTTNNSHGSIRLKEGHQSQNGCQQDQNTTGSRERGSALRFIWFIILEGVIFLRVGPTGFIPVWIFEAQRLHAVLDKLTDGSFRSVTHTSVQLLTLRYFAHFGDHIPASVCADRPTEKFPTMFQIIVHCGAALRVPFALVPGFCAARAGSPGQARLDGPFGLCA